MLQKRLLFITSIFVMGIGICDSQTLQVSPLEYKVSKDYFQQHYVKDAEDQKIVDLFAKKNKGVLIWVALGGASSFLASATPFIPLGNNFGMSPFTPVSLSIFTVSIVKGCRYSRKKKFMFVTGKQPLPNYVRNRVEISK